MDPFSELERAVREAVAALEGEGVLPPGLDLERIAVEPPRDPALGDVATNAALVLAKAAGAVPRELAQTIAARLAGSPDIAAAEVAGPGFINLRLEASFWSRVVTAALDEGERYGRSDWGRGLKANVEFVSANPTGPLHVGHCRGAVYGDALANLLSEAGAAVTREYYINDAGAQVDALARSAYLRYREALGETIGEIPAGLYPGEYLGPVGAALAAAHGRGLLAMAEPEWLPIVRERTIAELMAVIRDDLARLGIHHDVFFSERSLHGADGDIARGIAELRERGYVYVGRLPPPKGQPSEDWEDREQLLFRATEVGDDIDRPLVKSDGQYTYLAADVAYFRNKFERGFRDMIYVLGADHGGYVKRLEAVARAIAGDRAQVVVRLCQLVRLFRAGAPVRMSKRAGEFVTLREVVDEVGADVVRFMMLYRKNDAPLDFDFAKVTEQSRDNPVFYVQYAHARIASVFRNAAQELDANQTAAQLRKSDLGRLTDEMEIALIRRIAAYPRIVHGAAQAHEPHRVAFYLYELASDFHSLWNKGKESPHLRFIVAKDVGTTRARLALLAALRYVLGNGLRILGVRPVDEM